jgi:hypothetical protein
LPNWDQARFEDLQVGEQREDLVQIRKVTKLEVLPYLPYLPHQLAALGRSGTGSSAKPTPPAVMRALFGLSNRGRLPPQRCRWYRHRRRI